MGILERMRVCIIGAGAVGGLLGGLAAEGGHEVCFAGSPSSMRELAARGLRLVLPSGRVRLRKVLTADLAPARWRPELSIVALKRHQLRELGTLPPAARASELLVLNADEGRPLLGFTLLTAVMLQHGEVELASGRSVLLLPRQDAVRELSASWKAAGLEIAETDEPESLAGSFFLWQLLFLPAALCHSTLGHLLAAEAGREIASGVLGEGLAVWRRLGRPLRKLPLHDPQELAQRLARRPEEFDAAGLLPDREYSSLLQSILRQQKTEARELNERLVRQAAEVGLGAPWNWRLAQKVGRVVQAGFFRDPGELRRALI
jgi:2-dehydropantoate 2-reductase